MEQTAVRLRELIVFVHSLERTGFDQWHRPIRPGKWSIHEILSHIWLWDTYSLEHMIPFMRDGAILHFPNHTSINGNAERFARTIGKAGMIRHLTETRNELVEVYAAASNKEVRFYVGKTRLDTDTYCRKYILEHDRHHMAQIEAFVSH
ncbi:DinB family protein [Paenibacillus mesophilus]|uniref:DinB family protein n=1 Tax=Paenibacillus mesophilus TaxID=2582849 RepID=UPI00110D8FBE|nr:DinB family protein [Paenibacillus mesophilus]TMV43688.1 DinB family protein [Paenibacillus mesophilus]